MKKGWCLTSQPIITANCRARNGNVWTVPVGGGVARIMKFGFQAVESSGEVFWQWSLSKKEPRRAACGGQILVLLP
jgi:hypothetical protein